MKVVAKIVGILALTTTASSAMALPTLSPQDVRTPLGIERVASWRYDDNCGWRGGRWIVDLGTGKLVSCRPRRPDRAYSWHREGGREGWYDGRRRAWHNNNW